MRHVFIEPFLHDSPDQAVHRSLLAPPHCPVIRTYRID